MAVVITKDDFQKEVLEAKVPVLVDFFATWCGPCKMLAPILDQLSEQTGQEAKVFKVDIDQSPELAAEYAITSVPTLIVFKEGKPAETSVGAKPLPQLKAMLGL